MESSYRFAVAGIALSLTACSVSLGAARMLGAGLRIEAGGEAIQVDGHAVPILEDWTGDGLADLVLGDGGTAVIGTRVRVYPNVGTASWPEFDTFSYVQAGEEDLYSRGKECESCPPLGSYPRLVDFNSDGARDVLFGTTDGNLDLHLNSGTNTAPVYDPVADRLQRYNNTTGQHEDFKVVERAFPAVTDWDEDGRKDVLVGDAIGYITLLRNVGTDAAPAFDTDNSFYLQVAGVGMLQVPDWYAAPVVTDWNEDGRKDLLVGNGAGRVVLYANEGLNEAPVFTGYEYIQAAGRTLDLPGSGVRAAPALADFNGDGKDDLLLGTEQGTAWVFLSMPDAPVPGDFHGDGLVTAADIDLLQAEIAAGDNIGFFDLTGDGLVDTDDTDELIWNILGTRYGDATLDAHVDAADLSLLAAHWQTTDGAGWAEADFTGDGAVDAADLSLLAGSWQFTAPPVSAPEPATLIILTGGLLGPLSKRRRSSTS